MDSISKQFELTRKKLTSKSKREKLIKEVTIEKSLTNSASKRIHKVIKIMHFWYSFY